MDDIKTLTYKVTKEGATEPPFSGEYNNNKKTGNNNTILKMMIIRRANGAGRARSWAL